MRDIRDALIGAALGAFCGFIIVSVAVKTFDHFAPPSPYLKRK